jgi:hypothetical protein
MPLVPAPPRLLDDDRALRFGQYRGALRDVDISDVRLPGWGLASGLRLKRWQHFCVVHPEVALTFAIVHTGYLQLAWVQAIDRVSGETVEHAGRWPLMRTQVARSLWNEHSRASGSGIQLQVHNHLDAGRHDIELDSQGSGQELHARLRCHHDAARTEALVVCLPVGRGRGAYSHKVPLPVSGELRAFGRDFQLDAQECTAILDIHQAHYPRETWWRWATFVGRDQRGRRVAVNLTRNVVTDEDIHENALWIDGRLQLLGPSAFDLDREPWRAGTADGGSSLRFQPQGEREEDLNLGVVVSRFRQRFGTFSGRVTGSEGPIELVEAFGLFEDHSATW